MLGKVAGEQEAGSSYVCGDGEPTHRESGGEMGEEGDDKDASGGGIERVEIAAPLEAS